MKARGAIHAIGAAGGDTKRRQNAGARGDCFGKSRLLKRGLHEVGNKHRETRPATEAWNDLYETAN